MLFEVVVDGRVLAGSNPLVAVADIIVGSVGIIVVPVAVKVAVDKGLYDPVTYDVVGSGVPKVVVGIGPSD